MPVRNAKEDDISQIVALLATGEGGLLSRGVEEVKRGIEGYVVFDINGMVIATAGFTRIDESLGQIQSVVVAAAYRGENLGREVIIAAENKADTERLFVITKSPDYFARFGYGSKWKGKQMMIKGK